MTKRAFGKELNDILGVSKLPSKGHAEYGGVHRELKSLFPHEIGPGAYQPRKHFDQESLQELSASIKEKGILQPLIVRKTSDGYELIAGERRWRAAQMAGLKQVPAVVCEVDNNAALAYSLIENIQRQDLNLIEEAVALKRLVEEFAMTHEMVSKVVGKSRSMVTNMLRLLNLTDQVKEMLAKKELEMGHVRPLLSLPQSQQAEAAKIIYNRKMTARAAENYIASLQNTHKNSTDVSSIQDIRLTSWEKELEVLLEAKTRIQVNKKGEGKVIFHFSTSDKLDAIIGKLFKIKN